MLTLAGVSHKTAPLDIRERLAFTTSELQELLPALRDRFGPTLLLSTCNRTEIYVSGDGGLAAGPPLIRYLAGRKGVDLPAQSDHFYYHEGLAAVRHLFRVAAGVESMVLGEAQILGQVRGALLAAERAESVDRLLTRLVQNAIGAARKARAGTGIGRYAASVSSAAVELARRRFGDLSQRTVLVISTGEAGKLTARSLLESGAGRILISSRTRSRAEALAAQLGGEALPFDQLDRGLIEADIVISSTGARGFQVERPLVERILARRPARPLLVIDLAVPRDIDPAVGDLPGVSLYDIDGLQAGVDAGAEGGQATLARVEGQLNLEVERFMAWWQSRRVVPTISALRDQAEQIRRIELDKTLGRLPHLSDEERSRIDALTAAIVNKLLHQPITRLKAREHEPHYLETVRELFALQAPAAPTDHAR